MCIFLWRVFRQLRKSRYTNYFSNGFSAAEKPLSIAMTKELAISGKHSPKHPIGCEQQSPSTPPLVGLYCTDLALDSRTLSCTQLQLWGLGFEYLENKENKTDKFPLMCNERCTNLKFICLKLLQLINYQTLYKITFRKSVIAWFVESSGWMK